MKSFSIPFKNIVNHLKNSLLVVFSNQLKSIGFYSSTAIWREISVIAQIIPGFGVEFAAERPLLTATGYGIKRAPLRQLIHTDAVTSRWVPHLKRGCEMGCSEA